MQVYKCELFTALIQQTLPANLQSTEKLPFDHEKSKVLHKLCFEMIIQDKLPFNFDNEHGFVRFVRKKLQYVFQNRRGWEYQESRGNREGDGIWAAGPGSGRDRAGTLPAEG